MLLGLKLSFALFGTGDLAKSSHPLSLSVPFAKWRCNINPAACEISKKVDEVPGSQ